MGAFERIDATMQGVGWLRNGKEPRVERPALGEDRDCDLAVVGGGFTGLSTALHASAAGLDVVLLEAGTIGCGASGRTGGFAVPHFPGAVRPSSVPGLIGTRRGNALVELVGAGPDRLMELINRYQIACDARQNGWIQPAHSQRALRKVKAIHDDWRALGAAVRWLDAKSFHDMTGGARYLGGWYHASGIHLNGWALCLGLARAAAQEGAAIHERSAVTAIGRADGHLVLTVNGHRVRARKVLLATNGYTAPLVADEERSAVPVHLFHVTTVPLPAELKARVNPGELCFTDLRRSGGFHRFDIEGRVISGGAVFALANRRAYSQAHARRRMAEIYPELQGVALDSYWEGWCAITRDYLPRVQVLAPEVYWLGGFSTRGVALAPSIGRAFGEFLAERRTLEDVPLEVVDGVWRYPWQPVKAAAARVIYPCYQALDRLGLS